MHNGTQWIRRRLTALGEVRRNLPEFEPSTTAALARCMIAVIDMFRLYPYREWTAKHRNNQTLLINEKKN